MKEIEYDVIVCGGGFTGLNLAEKWRRLTGDRVVVISDELGGLIGSFEDKGFTFDYGGHVYTTTHKELADILVEAGAHIHSRHAYYHKGGPDWDKDMIDYPVQDHPFELIGEALKGATQDYKGQSLENFIVETFGMKFFKEWYEPFNDRVWTISPHRMDCDWVSGRVKLEREIDSAWGPNHQFYYAKGNEIINVLTGRLRKCGAEIMRGRIVSCDVEHRAINAILRGNEYKVKAKKYIFWTLPLTSLLHQVGLTSELFISNRVRTIGVGLKYLVGLPPFDWAYCNVKSAVHRVTQLDRYLDNMAPENCSSLLFEIPYRLPDRPLPLFAAGSIDGTQHTDFVTGHYRTGFDVIKYSGMIELFTSCKQSDIATVMLGDCMGYPVPMQGLRAQVAAAKSRLMKYNIYTAGRWGSWAYFNLDHCIRDVNECLEFVYNPIDPHNYKWSPFYYKPYAVKPE